MRARTLELPKSPTPDTALVIYSDGQVSRHPVLVQGQQFAMGAGNLLSSGGMKRLLTPYSQELSSQVERDMRCFLPPHVFCKSHNCIGWTVAPKKAPMWFAEFGLNRVPWPQLVFFAEAKDTLISLKVFACKDKNISPETQLFHAPLMNIGRTGELCFGSATRPNSFSLDSLPVLEQAVFETRFSHTNHSETLKIGNEDKDITNQEHLSFWKSLSKKDRFPVGCLKMTPWTVTDLIKGAIQ